MTTQEAFDTVWDYFVTQERPYSMDDENTCQYRGNDGTKCAVGCLIPDSIYKEDMECWPSIPGLLHVFPEVMELFTGIEDSFLIRLQESHDDAADLAAGQRDDALFTTQVRDNLILVANQYDLVVPV